MSYSVDELFSFLEAVSCYNLMMFNQRAYFNPLEKKVERFVTEVTVPTEYKGKPVAVISAYAFRDAVHLEKITIPEGIQLIDEHAFYHCKKLRSVSLPASLKHIGDKAFAFCGELREVEFKSSPSLGVDVFSCDLALPAELYLTGVLRSRDLTRAPFDHELLDEMLYSEFSWLFRRPDVFALAVKNNCFRHIGAECLYRLFEFFIKNGRAEQLKNAEDIDRLTAAMMSKLIELSVREENPEITAYLLDLTNRKFGFTGGRDFEL